MAVLGLRVSVAGPTTSVSRATDGATLVASVDTAIDALEAASLADTIAAMAVLQADGALPTEAHVDTCDTALIALTAAIAAVQTGVTVPGAVQVAGDVVIYVDATAVTANELRVAFDAAYNHLVRSRGALSLA